MAPAVHKNNYMAVLCGMPTIQYSTGSSPLSVRKLFTSCIGWCLVSRACDWVMSALSAMLLIFSFQFSLLFFHVGQPGSTEGLLIYPISNIRRCPKFGSVSCMVKMKTRHPVEGSVGSEFPAICNYCIVMAARYCKMLKFCENFFCIFLKKRPLTLKCSKFCSESFHCDTDWRCCVQMW